MTKEQREAALRVVTYADPPESHFAEWILRLDEPEEPAVEGVSAGQGTPTDFLARYLAERAKILTRFAELERERDEARAERDEALAVRANQEATIDDLGKAFANAVDERDEARAALATARSDALEQARRDGGGGGRMKPLHPQVRIVDAGDRTRTLYIVEAYDGDVWEQIDPMPMARDWAEKRARWLSDVLEHAATPTPEAMPLDDWSERDGPALWWRFPIEEPPYAGTPLDDDFPRHVTHWTRIVLPNTPRQGVRNG